MSFKRCASESRLPVTGPPGALPVPMLMINRSASGQISRDSLLASTIGLFLFRAPSTNNSLCGPIITGSKNVDAAEVARAASHILQTSKRLSLKLLDSYERITAGAPFSPRTAQTNLELD